MTTALITGGAGFIGSHVAERFLAEGWDVHIVDNFSTGKRANVPAGATLLEADIGAVAAADLVRLLRPTVLVHLAAQMDVRRSVAEPVAGALAGWVGAETSSLPGATTWSIGRELSIPGGPFDSGWGVWRS